MINSYSSTMNVFLTEFFCVLNVKKNNIITNKEYFSWYSLKIWFLLVYCENLPNIVYILYMSKLK